jgi:hypothetical protein
MLSSIKSTVRIDPVRSAIAKAERLAEEGDWDRAIAELERMREQHGTRDDLKAKLDELRRAQAQAMQEEAGGRWWIWAGGIGLLIGAGVWLF